MPSKKKGYTIIFPSDLQQIVERDAELNIRSISNQVVTNLYEYYAHKKRSAEMFTPQGLGAGKEEEIPKFRWPEESVVEDPSKQKKVFRRGNT